MVRRLLEKLKLIKPRQPLLPQAHVKCQLPHPVQFGRWLLKYCEPVWDSAAIAHNVRLLAVSAGSRIASL